MKTITLSGTVQADDIQAVSCEIASILGANSDNDFQVQKPYIIEYDAEEQDSVYWSIDHVSKNEDGTASHAKISC